MSPLERTRGDGEDDACLSDLRLDQARVGELAQEALAELDAHLRSCARCRERQRSLDEAHAQVEVPPLHLPAPKALGEALGEATPGRRWWRAGAAGLAVAAAALLVVFVRPTGPDELSVDASAGPGPTTRTKGGPTLHFHVRRDGRVFEGGPGELIRPGDALRFAYSWPEGGSIAVLSRDGAGTVSAYFPPGDHTFPAAGGQEIDLPGAILLDDVVGDEILFGIFCAEPRSIATLERAIDARPDDPEVAGCQIDRVRVDKRALR